MRRPLGVILSCIVLGLAALMLLLMAAGSLLTVAMAGHMPATPQSPQPAAMPGIVRVFSIVFTFVYAALAAWAVATIVGLVRMKNWARISTMIIGGGLALIGLVSAPVMFLIPKMIPPAQMQADQNPALLHAVIIVMGLCCVAVGAVGIWWLVYFTLRSTRNAFTLAANPPAPPPLGYVPPPSPYAASSYEVASYIPAPDPDTPPAVCATPIPGPIEAPANTSPRRPLAVSIIGWLLIVGSLCGLPSLLAPLPLFVMGVVMTGWAAHLTALCFVTIFALTGIGLLRLEKIALYAACALQVIGILNAGLMMLPSTRDRMLSYTNLLTQKMLGGAAPPPAFDNHTMGLMMIPGIVLGCGLCLVVLVLLIYYRAAFNRQAAAA